MLKFGIYLSEIMRFYPKSHFFIAYFGNNLYLCGNFQIYNSQITKL